MEDQEMYKDNFLIPILRKRVSELSSIALELEATVIFQNNKIKELNDKIANLTFIQNEDSSSPARSKKKLSSSEKSSSMADGGTF